MPYDRSTNFSPDEKFKKAWSLVPKNNDFRLSFDDLTAPRMHDELSSIIPLFYILTILAVIFDIYLGVFVLSKSGVNIWLIIVSIIADILLAIIVYIFASKSDIFNTIKNKNLIFIKKMQMKTREKNEDDRKYSHRKNYLFKEIKKIKSHILITNIIKISAIIILFGIAYWKIHTYMSVLPPSLSIWATMRGKIVIIMALLTAIFHAIATEQTTAAWWFKSRRNKSIKAFESKGEGELEVKEQPTAINYVADFVPRDEGYVKLIEGDNGYEIRYKNNVIWDSDIMKLIQVQTDDDAKRAIAIVCKEVQCN